MTNMPINCNTQIQHKPYQYHECRCIPRNITEGLSEEGFGYVQEAIDRTTEKPLGYDSEGCPIKVLDKNGLMPEDGKETLALYCLDSSKNIVGSLWDSLESNQGNCQYLQVEWNEDKSGFKAIYDTDKDGTMDRSATYTRAEYENYVKIEETFDADGDGTNEVVLKRDNYEATPRYLEKTVENPEYNVMLDGALGSIGFLDWDSKPKYIEVKEFAGYNINYETTLGVNADDMGWDEKYGDHFEYFETTQKCNINDHPTKQLYLEWPSATRSEFTITEEYGETFSETAWEKYYE